MSENYDFRRAPFEKKLINVDLYRELRSIKDALLLLNDTQQRIFECIATESLKKTQTKAEKIWNILSQ